MSDKLTFSDVVLRISTDLDLSQSFVRKILNEAAIITRDGLLTQKRVNLVGLGKFSVKFRKSRPGRNPQTGEQIEIPAHSLVSFRPDNDLKDFINREYYDIPIKSLGRKSKKPPVEEPQAQEESSPEPKQEPIVEQPEQEEKLLQTEPSTISQKQDVYIPKEKPRFFSSKARVIVASALSIVLIILLFSIFLGDDKKVSLDQEEKEQKPLIEEESSDKIISKPKEEEQTTPAEYIETQEKKRISLVENYPVKKSNESFWKIADIFYKNPYFWPNIYRNNEQLVPNPDILKLGLEISVPLLEGTSESLTEYDLIDIAEGYIKVYFAYKRFGRSDAVFYLWVAKILDVPGLIENYSDRIDKDDFNAIEIMEGSSIIRK